MNFILILVAVSCLIGELIHGYSVHFVTYNVKDNLLMPALEITNKIVDDLLFIGRGHTEKSKDIYVVALQENCFHCDSKNIHKLAEIFLHRLNLHNNTYTLIGHAATRDNNHCETVSCNPFASQHGTSVIMVFALNEIVESYDTRKRNRCASGRIRNSEKGLVGMQLHMNDGKKLCFVAGHLDAGGVEGRLKCIVNFFGELQSRGIRLSWLSQFSSANDNDDNEPDAKDPNPFTNCDSIFLAGDLNTRTGAKNIALDYDDFGDGTLLNDVDYENLLELDEFSGSKPYSGQSLLKFLQDVTQRPFKEPMQPIRDSQTFLPTYSLLDKKKCKGKAPCYSRERPISWTDRIACHNCGDVKFYSSLSHMHSFSDHLPVVGIFENL